MPKIKKKKAPRRMIHVPRLSDALVIPEDYALDTQGITQSLFRCWHRCRVAFVLKLNRWTRADRARVTGFGSMFHSLLDRAYAWTEKKKKRPSYKLLEKWIDATEESDDTRGIPEEQLNLHLAVLSVLLPAYVEFYSEDFRRVRFTDIEVPFEATLDDKYILRGKKDARFRDKSKKRWVGERKTMARIVLDPLLKSLSIDFQNLFYVTADELEHGEEVTGVLYDLIRNPGHKPRKDEEMPDFCNRLRGEIEKNPEYFFLRYEIPYTKGDKRRFLDNLRKKLREIERFLDGELDIYPCETNCMGRFNCEFLDACSSGKMIGYRQTEHLFPELEL